MDRTTDRTLRFSHRTIDALKQPKKDRVEYSDSVEVGLRLVHYASGRKVFRHRATLLGQKIAMTIGEYPAVNVEEARKRTQEQKAMTSKGDDPRDERNRLREALTVAEFAREHYLPWAKKARRSVVDLENRLKLRVLPTFGDRKLTLVNRQMVAAMHQRVLRDVSAVTANRDLCLVSSLYNRAIELGHATENPAKGIKKHREPGPRQRTLSDDELKRFVAALRQDMGNPQVRALYPLLATGLRKMEVLSLRWEHVDLERKQAYLPHTKSGKPRFAVLNTLAIELLQEILKDRKGDAPWVFPSKGKSGHLREIRGSFDTVKEQAGVSNLRLHDLRRSFATLLIDSDISIYAVSNLLGHSDVRVTQSAYAHLTQKTLERASETAADVLSRAVMN